MAIAAARSLATFAENRGITPDNIIANMEETDVFPNEAADVAVQAAKDGLARVEISREEVYKQAEADIKHSRETVKMMMDEGFIKPPPQEMFDQALDWAVSQVK